MLPRTSPRLLRLASGAVVAVTGGIVVSGAAVRLSDSGLGCPTWPNCRPGQLTSSGLDLHGAIEFGNRLVTVAVVAIVAAAAVLIWRLPERRPDLRLLSATMVLGILANAVVGGLTVLLDLAPLLVASHLLLNMALLWVAIALHRRTHDGPPPPGLASRELRWVAGALVVVTGLVLVAGTLTTGAGPHAGDASAPRLGLPLERITAAHADLAMVTTGLVLALLLLTRLQSCSARLRRRTTWLAGVVAGQAALGFVQYLTGLPAVLVLVHVAGATLLWGLAIGVLQLSAGRTTTAAGSRQTLREPMHRG